MSSLDDRKLKFYAINGANSCKLTSTSVRENVLLSMEKLIKYVCLKGKFCAYGEDSRKSFQASF